MAPTIDERGNALVVQIKSLIKEFTDRQIMLPNEIRQLLTKLPDEVKTTLELTGKMAIKNEAELSQEEFDTLLQDSIKCFEKQIGMWPLNLRNEVKAKNKTRNINSSPVKPVAHIVQTETHQSRKEMITVKKLLSTEEKKELIKPKIYNDDKRSQRDNRARYDPVRKHTLDTFRDARSFVPPRGPTHSQAGKI